MSVDRHEHRQITAGSSEGVILGEPDQSIAYATAAALALHGTGSLDELGPTVDACREGLCLCSRNDRASDQYPIARVVAGEHCRDVIVEVARPGRSEFDFVHSLRSLVATDRERKPRSARAPSALQKRSE